MHNHIQCNIFLFVDGASGRFCARGVSTAAPPRATNSLLRLGQYHDLTGRQSCTHSCMGIRIYLAIFKVGRYFFSSEATL